MSCGYDQQQMQHFYGEYSSNPCEFVLSANEKALLWKLAKHVKQTADQFGINSNLSHFRLNKHIENELESHLVDGYFKTKNTSLLNLTEQVDPKSRTHDFLSRLKAVADRNVSKTKPGYRFDEDLKRIASYLRMIAGPLAYQTIHKNLELALPSLSSTNRYIRCMNAPIIEGVVRSSELLNYLNERNLPLIVSLSEDATRIDGRIQYNSGTNEIYGFVLPIDEITGMPIPHTFKARNTAEIVSHFRSENPISQFVNVVMAQPLANAPPFCLLLFGTDAKYTSEHVMKRWDFIVRELSKMNIRVLSISSDSDPKYNSAMRKKCMLGETSNIFDFVNKSDQVDFGNAPFYVQDTVHIATKIRNFLLKTLSEPRKLPFGAKKFVKLGDLKFLMKNFPKDQHQLTPSTFDSLDKQNFGSVMRIIDEKVITLLKLYVRNSEATVKFLEIVRDLIEAFTKVDLSPLKRIEKIWSAVFLIRIWRRFIIARRGSTLKHNFLTQNCYACIEINAHNLVLIMLYLRKLNKPNLFLPYLLSSQPCEGFFRQIRSFTSTYSTVANCSIKEILGRIYKIQLQNDIAIKSNFIFPRSKGIEVASSNQNTHDLPSKQQIFEQIEQCGKEALKFACEIGLTNAHSIESFIYDCPIEPIKSKCKEPKLREKQFEYSSLCPPFMKPCSVALKNYADKFLNKPVPETAPYAEIKCSNGKRIVVKKTSLCWLLRKDPVKLSSDRLHRVKAPFSDQKKITRSFNKSKSKYKKPGLLYNSM